jgi:hypothetical protein
MKVNEARASGNWRGIYELRFQISISEFRFDTHPCPPLKPYVVLSLNRWRKGVEICLARLRNKSLKLVEDPDGLEIL